MKLAILIQCHKNPEQINRLLERLDHPSVDCFVHIDKKQKFADQIIKRKNVYVLPESERVSVKWAQISQVTATLNLLTAAYSTENRLLLADQRARLAAGCSRKNRRFF